MKFGWPMITAENKAMVKKAIVKKKKTKKVVETKESLAVGYDGEKFVLLSRLAIGKKQELIISESPEGEKFSQRRQKIILQDKNGKPEIIAKCRDFRLFLQGKDLIITYVRERGRRDVFTGAKTKDKTNWQVFASLPEIAEPGLFIPKITASDYDLIYFGGQKLNIAFAGEKKNWQTIVFSETPGRFFYDELPFKVFGAMPVQNDRAIFYATETRVDILADNNLHDQKVGEEIFIKIGVAFFAKNNPTQVLWQTNTPLVEIPLTSVGALKLIGLVSLPKKTKVLRFYLARPDGQITYFELTEKFLTNFSPKQEAQQLAPIEKAPNNPIISPAPYDWEAGGAFNPTALDLGGRVHLLYRAVGRDDFSRIGYASSSDGVVVDERIPYPIYRPRASFEGGSIPAVAGGGLFASGGSWGGCEDPKMAKIGHRIYMTYVAHNGTWP
ncbi:MAG: hypothetical protein NTV48_03265, partial [Candidatus Vogelbacteria bacterium]|nr:hypothetical protein [Candidatus Vogelbacteria bacterium]